MAVHVQAGDVLQEGMRGEEVKGLQATLRGLGYLRSGVDGIFGTGTGDAVRALQYDLLYNEGEDASGEEADRAPVAMTSFNDDGLGGKLVSDISGTCDVKLAQAMNALLACDAIGLVPESADPVAANAAVAEEILAVAHPSAPPEFVLAVVRQESGGQQYRTLVSDHYMVVGLDHSDPAYPERITSRGYGIGQYKLFHQPPGRTEMTALGQPENNVSKVFSVLLDKFSNYLIGKTSGTTADDRVAEHGRVPLRACQYTEDNPKYMCDCKTCAAVKTVDITEGTPYYPGSSGTYKPTQYYASANYKGVPEAASFPCDWPYAVRRYNGSGVNSYHYQCKVLLNLLK